MNFKNVTAKHHDGLGAAIVATANNEMEWMNSTPTRLEALFIVHIDSYA